MNENELAIVKIISSSGESKAKAFEALKCVKTKEFNKARELIKESRHLDLEAHNMQTQWIQQEMSQEGESVVGMLMVHAQDHYMTSQLARDLIEELVEVFDHLFSKVNDTIN